MPIMDYNTVEVVYFGRLGDSFTLKGEFAALDIAPEPILEGNILNPEGLVAACDTL